MGFFDKLAGNYAENIWKSFTDPKNILPNLATGGMYSGVKSQLKTAGEANKDYQYRNAGKQAEQEMIKSREAAGLAASQQAQQELEKGSKLASLAYGASGGMNMQSFTNRSQTKKSILGSF